MDEFPDPEDEFELMYGDELDVLREQEEIGVAPKQTRKSLDFTSTNATDNSKDLFTPLTQQTINNFNNQDSFENDFTPLEDNTNLRKRTVEELFGDIDDILYENQTQAKRHKGDDYNDDYAMIEHILELRRLAKLRDVPDILKRDPVTIINRDKDNLSLSVPKYPFIAVVRHDGQRVYVRCHSEQYQKEERLRFTEEIAMIGALGDKFKDIWKEAQIIIDRNLNNEEVEVAPVQPKTNDKELWVDLYKPRKYFELLSEESTNRIMLKWMKLWDKIVFKRRPKIKIIKSTETKKPKELELNTDLDEYGRPYHKVALLCGPPGLGKTTLAHMVARHAGYNVVEINASDDRSVETFKTILENSTQMRSILDKEKRPNCLIFDEIDGAPQASIDYLVKFVTGTTPKNKKNPKNILRRPIICICNDVYVPSLRPLRQIAFVVNFPATSNLRLAERLMEIARRQKIKTHLGAMLALAEKSHNDIRSCLSVLHFLKAQKKEVTLSDVHRANVGQKDTQKGLFAVWQDIFQIERPKSNQDNKHSYPSLKERMDKILTVVNSFGEYDKIAQGVFENYPKLNYKNTDLKNTCEALDWFCFTDILNKQILTSQNYTLTTYMPFAFVIWHFTFSSRNWQKLQYPSAGYEVKIKQNRQRAMIKELMRGMQPTIRSYVQPVSLLLDVLPLLTTIIVPPFREISLHLYTDEEKTCLNQVVNIMIDYNLNYIQERTPDGNYIYKLDPDIDEIVSFGIKNTLSYSNKQLIAKEIETVKMRKIEKSSPPPQLPNHLQTLKAKSLRSVEMPVMAKDFFGRVVTKKSAIASSDLGQKMSASIRRKTRGQPKRELDHATEITAQDFKKRRLSGTSEAKKIEHEKDCCFIDFLVDFEEKQNKMIAQLDEIKEHLSVKYV